MPRGDGCVVKLLCALPSRVAHLGKKVWQAVVCVLHFIQLITHTIGYHHAIFALLRVNDLRNKAVACSSPGSPEISTLSC